VSFVLRKVNKAKWYKNINTSWLPQGELQADVFSSDLRTQNNSLSVWYVDDDRSNFERIVAALVVKQNRLTEFDYALIEFNVTGDLNIRTADVSGDTVDSEVNRWHLDFIELTASKLFNFALAIQAKAEIERVQIPQVEELVKRSFELGYLDNSKIELEMLARIQRL
jgi:hypothetical protein